MVTNLSTFVMSTLRLAADEPELAEATLRQALGQWTQQGFHIQHNEWFGAEVKIRMYRRDYKDAWNFFTTRYAPSLARFAPESHPEAQDFLLRQAGSAVRSPGDGARPTPGLLCKCSAEPADARRLDREEMPWSSALA